MKLLVALLALIALCGAAQAQDYPNRSVRIIVPAAAGSVPDFLARTIGQRLSENWRQPVVIDNILGAGGNIGTDRAAKAPADGYTLLLNTIAPIAVNQSLMGKLPYDPVKDLAPITQVANTANILAVHPSFPAKSLQDIIRLAKEQPGKLSYPSGGHGTTQHLSGELLNTMAGIKLVHIPYKSTGQMTTDALGGQIQIIFHNAPVLLPHVRSGAQRGIAVTSAKRQPYAAELPTMGEAGLPGFEVSAFFGFMAPAGVPQAIIAKLHGEIVAIMALPDMRERFLAQAAEPVGNRPDEYAAFIQSEIVKWAKVVKEAGLKVD
ncbi:MAG: tripartite tricarboxylate transporter substrate binding protein [Pseudomonadota bacterium]|nr:tripartite tricarboxylate transporter substrate binding protein [Pseudomonadota bacterium]